MGSPTSGSRSGAGNAHYERFLTARPEAPERVDIEAALYRFSRRVARLIVTAPPGAEVLVDGSPPEVTPPSPLTVTIGHHRVEVRRADQAPAVSGADARAGRSSQADTAGRARRGRPRRTRGARLGHRGYLLLQPGSGFQRLGAGPHPGPGQLGRRQRPREPARVRGRQLRRVPHRVRRDNPGPPGARRLGPRAGRVVVRLRLPVHALSRRRGRTDRWLRRGRAHARGAGRGRRAAARRSVAIDVRPGCGTNWIVPDAPDLLEVAIHGSAELDVTRSSSDLGSGARAAPWCSRRTRPATAWQSDRGARCAAEWPGLDATRVTLTGAMPSSQTLVG